MIVWKYENSIITEAKPELIWKFEITDHNITNSLGIDFSTFIKILEKGDL